MHGLVPVSRKERSFAGSAHGNRVGGRDYDGLMALSLVVGPAHAGKVALLLDRFLETIEHDPWLIVPNRSDVDRVERDLLSRLPISSRGGSGRSTISSTRSRWGLRGAGRWSRAARELAVRRAVASSELTDLASSAGTPGFADSLLRASPSSMPRSSTPHRLTATWRGCGAPTTPSSTGSDSSTARVYGCWLCGGLPPSSTRGPCDRCLPTASRISPRRNGRCSRPSPAGRRSRSRSRTSPVVRPLRP